MDLRRGVFGLLNLIKKIFINASYCPKRKPLSVSYKKIKKFCYLQYAAGVDIFLNSRPKTQISSMSGNRHSRMRGPEIKLIQIVNFNLCNNNIYRRNGTFL